MEEDLREQISRRFCDGQADIRTYSPLSLAFLGDAVYSLIIRTAVVSAGSRQPEKLHTDTAYYVRADYQAQLGKAVYDLMTPEEQKVFRRGKNANPGHFPKSASHEEYLLATALEALCGYLYLTDRTERLLDLLKEGMERMQRRGIRQ